MRTTSLRGEVADTGSLPRHIRGRGPPEWWSSRAHLGTPYPRGALRTPFGRPAGVTMTHRSGGPLKARPYRCVAFHLVERPRQTPSGWGIDQVAQVPGHPSVRSPTRVGVEKIRETRLNLIIGDHM